MQPFLSILSLPIIGLHIFIFSSVEKYVTGVELLETFVSPEATTQAKNKPNSTLAQMPYEQLKQAHSPFGNTYSDVSALLN